MKKRVYRELYYGTPEVDENIEKDVIVVENEPKKEKKKKTRLLDKFKKSKKKSDK